MRKLSGLFDGLVYQKPSVPSLVEDVDKKAKGKTGPRSERSSIVQQFVEQINLERKAQKKKPYDPKFIAFKLSHIKGNSDLYYMLSVGKDYQKRHGSFSKYFFGALKSK